LHRHNDEPLHPGAASFVVPANLEIPMTEKSPSEFLSDEHFIKEHRRVFVMLVGRNGYSQAMSTEEVPRRRETVKLDACPKAYLRLQRAGSRFALDRRKKMEIAEIHHKAGEHAYFGFCVAFGIKTV